MNASAAAGGEEERLPGVVVTIDGPAGSGKSTTAREVARRLGYRHLDSGALYRALTLGLLQAGVREEEWDSLDAGRLAEIDVRLDPGEAGGVGLEVLLDGAPPGAGLRSPEVTGLVPHLARIPAARGRLLELQRSARALGGVVADGRDMGTEIFPSAEFKFFLTASLEERARRRLLQEGRSADRGAVREEADRIRRRDESDSARAISPLRQASDAFVIDTTRLSFEEQVDRIVDRVRSGLVGLTPGRAPE